MVGCSRRPGGGARGLRSHGIAVVFGAPAAVFTTTRPARGEETLVPASAIGFAIRRSGAAGRPSPSAPTPPGCLGSRPVACRRGWSRCCARRDRAPLAGVRVLGVGPLARAGGGGSGTPHAAVQCTRSRPTHHDSAASRMYAVKLAETRRPDGLGAALGEVLATRDSLEPTVRLLVAPTSLRLLRGHLVTSAPLLALFLTLVAGSGLGTLRISATGVRGHAPAAVFSVSLRPGRRPVRLLARELRHLAARVGGGVLARE